jgi:hypothetical protein
VIGQRWRMPTVEKSGRFAAPPVDEGGAAQRPGRQRKGFMVAGDSEQSGGQRRDEQGVGEAKCEKGFSSWPRAGFIGSGNRRAVAN